MTQLIPLCESVGIPMKKDQAAKFVRYYEMLVEWNQKMNLTTIVEPEQVMVKHFIDSLLILKEVEIKQGAKIVDVGTGAGFPGIPLQIMRPDMELTLLDGANKRLKFLQAVCEELGIRAAFVHKRAEEASRLSFMRETYDIVTARALARMSPLCEYCLPLVKMKGKFIAMKGPNLTEELAEAENAIELLGAKLVDLKTYSLPDAEKSGRSLVVLQKVAFTPKEYPRHGNKITKSPL